MITFIKEWANQIIVAVIISTIFEMLLPNGNNKKYIKMIIGIYVLFTMLHPIVTKITGKSIDISNFNYEKYFNDRILETSSENFAYSNSNIIEQAYIDNIKNDIQAKLFKIGYELIDCKIEIVSDEHKENYGEITTLILKIKQTEEKDQNRNEIEIQKIEVEIENGNIKEEYNITENEKEEIIMYIATEYSIDEKNIVID